MFDGSVRAGVLADVLEATGVLVDQCNLAFDPGCFGISVMEPSTIGGVELRLDEAAFDAYETSGVVVGASTENLLAFVRTVDSDRSVRLEIEDPRTLRLRSDGLEYETSLVNPDVLRNRPDLGSLELPATVELERHEMARIVTGAGLVASHVEMGIDAGEGEFYARAEGDADDFAARVPGEELVDFRPVDVSSTYPVEYLSDYYRVIPEGATVRMTFGEELPIKTHYDFADGRGSGTYFLAPRLA